MVRAMEACKDYYKYHASGMDQQSEVLVGMISELVQAVRWYQENYSAMQVRWAQADAQINLVYAHDSNLIDALEREHFKQITGHPPTVEFPPKLTS